MFIWLIIGIAVIVMLGIFIYISARKAKEEGEDAMEDKKEKKKDYNSN